jgi:quercetin dioxygenase-like cupin family protein
VIQVIVDYASTSVTPTGEKTTRRVLIHGPALMLVEFRFQKGGVGTPHRHAEHEQVGYIAKGSFEINVDGNVRTVFAGDTYYAGKNVLHGVVALEDDSVIIDAFTPPRADFL